MVSRTIYRVCTVIVLLCVVFINHYILSSLLDKSESHQKTNSFTTKGQGHIQTTYTAVKASTFPPRIMHWDTSWTDLSSSVNCHPRKGFVLRRLTAPVGALIYTYPAVLDTVISQAIAQKGMWEADIVSLLRHILSHDPGYILVDAGSNIGVFTVTAAKLKHPVVAVDCLLENVEHLCATLMVNNLVTNVTLVYNAISDNNDHVTIFRNPSNIGGTYVSNEGSTDPRPTVASITLDGLLGVHNLTGRRVVLKLDIETFEDKALRGGLQFFRQAIVDYVIVEVSYHEDKETGAFIGQFLRQHDMLPSLSGPSKGHPSVQVWKRQGDKE